MADETLTTSGFPADGPAELHTRPHTLRHRGRGSARITLNLTAMIDVVFLLLIYFMVGTNFKLGEEIYRLDLPERGVSAMQDPFQLDEEPLRIRVMSAGPGGGDCRIRLEGPYTQPADFDGLFEFLRDRQVNASTIGGLFLPTHPIIIEPTRTARWEHAVDVFNAAVRAEYTNITFGRPG